MRELAGYVERVDPGGKFFVIRVPTVGGVVPPPVSVQVAVTIPDTPQNLLAELRAWFSRNQANFEIQGGTATALREAVGLFGRVDDMLKPRGV